MSNLTDFLARGGIPIGAIVAGQFDGNANYLPCDGSDNWNTADYPLLDKTNLLSFRGSSWTPRTLATAVTTGPRIAFGAGLFVLIPSSSTSNAYQTSPDGITWTNRTFPVSAAWNDIIFANGLFVASGANAIYTSMDGLNWTARLTGAANTVGSLAFNADIGLFICVHASGTSATQYWTSPDGVTWTARNFAASVGSVRVYSVGARFYLVTNTPSIWITADGLNWLQNAISTPQNGAQFISVAGSGGVLFVDCNNILIRMSDEGFFPDPDAFFSNAGSLTIRSPAYSSSGRPCLSHFGGTYFGGNVRFVDGGPPVPHTFSFAPVGFAASPNRVVAVGESLSTVQTLDINTTKFRTPRMRRREDGARYFIRAR